MRGWDFGLLFGFLQKYRVLRSSSGSGQRLRKNEQELAAFFEHQATIEEKSFWSNFLQAQGFRIHRYDSFDMPGIPKDQYIYLMLRDGKGDLTPWASVDEALEKVRMKVGGKVESKDEASVWLGFIWFALLNLQYSKIGRGLSEVSRYQEAVFDIEHLVEFIRETLELKRKEVVDEPSTVRTILLGTESPKIKSRVTGFINIQQEIGHLIESEKNIFQQTLLAAAEIGVNFDDGLGLMAPLQEDGMAQEPMAQTETAFKLAENGEISTEQEI